MPLPSAVCTTPRYAATEVRPSSFRSKTKFNETSNSDSESSTSSSSSSSHSHHSKKSKKSFTRSDKKKLLNKLAKANENGFESKNLRRFLNSDKDVKTSFSPDGDITISGIKVLIPDYALDYKKNYDEELKKIRDLNCREKESISRWTRVSTVITAVLTFIIVIFGLIYIIYQAFFARSENSI